MLYRVNAYFAVLLITIFGSAASLIIIHVAFQNEFQIEHAGIDATTAPLTHTKFKH